MRSVPPTASAFAALRGLPYDAAAMKTSLDENQVTEHPTGRALADWLVEREHHFAAQRREWNTREDIWSWTRLGIAVAVIIAWILLSAMAWLPALLSVIGVGVFWYAVRRHSAALAQREHFDRLLLMISEAQQRGGGQITAIRGNARPADDAAGPVTLPACYDDGETWPLTEQERDDLDLYAAPVGIFGLLNRTSTAHGALRLRDLVEHPCLAAERITERQTLLRWLIEHDEARLHLMADLAALRLENTRFAKMLRAIDAAEPMTTSLSLLAMRAWSLVSFLICGVGIGQAAVGNFAWALLIVPPVLINAGLLSTVRDAIRKCLEGWQNTAWALKGFRIATESAASRLPSAGPLAELRERCKRVVTPGVLPLLQSRTGWVERGGFFWQLINLMTMVDWHITHAILQISATRRDDLLAAAAAVRELDAWLSLAAFGAEQPTTCWPELTETPVLEITRGVHPLVEPAQVVPNDAHLSLEERIWVVTGSNMAGKSTFLRMVGLNVLLGQVGCPALAERMRWRPLRLISDLRARDSLADRESYFLAEVRQLRRMVSPPADAAPVFGLIDEPFRGTNSADQSAASVAVLQHLLRSHGLYLLATHDGNLTELADGRTVRNFHFRENLTSAELVFDYTLHEGPARTRNALRILEREGYPEQLVAEARAWLTQRETQAPEPS